MISLKRLSAVGLAIALLIGAVFARTVSYHFVQADSGDSRYYAELPVGRSEIKSIRGMITDRSGNVLVTGLLALNVRARTVMVDDPGKKDEKGQPARKPALVMTDTRAVASLLGPAMGQQPDAIKTKLDTLVSNYGSGAFGSTLVAANLPVTFTQVFTNTTRELRRRGLEFEETTTRAYPQGSLAGPMLGFVSMQPRGYGGIEGYYDPRLRGADGFLVRRGILDLITATVEVDGAAMELSLDSGLQRYVEERLQSAITTNKATGGTIIVMDSRTGAIYASASQPSYDPARAIDIAGTSGMAKLRDAAVSDAYEPGSVFKLVTLAAGIDSGAIKPNSVFVDAGKFDVGGRYIYNAEYRAWGKVDLEDVLVHSINVIAATIARDMTAPVFYSYLSLFGFGQRTGIDLAGETSGILRTPNDALWTKADLATNSYGQGVAASPLQVVNAINVIANDGVLLQPYVVQEVRYADGRVINTRTTETKRVVTAESARFVRGIAAAATQAATPKALIPGYTVAGKTGTANWYQQGRRADTTIHTFVGMLPASSPRLTILVKLDEPRVTYAKDSTVPVFHDVAERAVQILGVPPDVAK